MKDLTSELNQNPQSPEIAQDNSGAAAVNFGPALTTEVPTSNKQKAPRAKGMARSQLASVKAKKSVKPEKKAPTVKKSKAPAKKKSKEQENEALPNTEQKSEVQLSDVEPKNEPLEKVATISSQVPLAVAEKDLDEPEEINVVEQVKKAITPDQSLLKQEPKVFGEHELEVFDSDLSQVHLKTQQDQILDQVRSQFHVSGSKFHFQDQPAKVAFKDKGSRMVSAFNDERVAKAMAAMAEGKGWKSIKVSGHPDFKREVWIEANLRGVEVQGFKPTEQDLKRLEDRRDRTMHNVVEPTESKLEQKIPAQFSGEVQKESLNPKEKTESKTEPGLSHNQQVLADMKKGIAEKQKTPSSEATAKNNQQILEQARAMANSRENGTAQVGRVVEHGPAKYKGDPQEKLNYFVKLETSSGEKTIWGIDLKRAISAGNIKVGDQIRLENKGKQPVTVEALLRDKAGNVIGKEQQKATRNVWEAEHSEKAQVVNAIGITFTEAKVKNPEHQRILKSALGDALAVREQTNKVPSVPHYEKSAPSKSQQERAVPMVERNVERAR